MNNKKMVLMTLVLSCLLLSVLFAVRGERVVRPSNGGSKAKEVIKLAPVKDLLDKVTQIAVFRLADREREYVGSLRKENPAFQDALNALRESQTAETSDVTEPQYELALMGEGFQRLGKYDPRAGTMALSAPGEKQLERETVVRLSGSFADLLTSAKLPDKPKEKLQPKHIAHADWPELPGSLVSAVRQSPVILIGKPVDLFRMDYFSSGTRHQYTVYLIQVERYLKDETGLHLPVVKYWDYGGLLGEGFQFDLIPLMDYDQRYLLFLQPGNQPGFGGMTLWDGKQIRLWYPDEFIHVRPSLQTPIVNGVTAQRNPKIGPVPYLFEDTTVLVGKREGQVIGEIMAAIKQAERERR